MSQLSSESNINTLLHNIDGEKICPESGTEKFDSERNQQNSRLVNGTHGTRGTANDGIQVCVQKSLYARPLMCSIGPGP